jgi:putative membrane protein
LWRSRPHLGRSSSAWSAAALSEAGDQKPATQSASHAAGDTSFAMKAAQANFAEVELGKLAQQKASSDDVKKFAQMMVDDHTKALDDLKSAAEHITSHGRPHSMPTTRSCRTGSRN